MADSLVLLSACFSATVAMTFLVSGASHLMKPEVGESSIRAVLKLKHRPSAIFNAAAGATELGLGVGLIIALFRPGTMPAAPLLQLASLLLIGYAGYLLLALRQRTGASCGCGSVAEEATLWTVVRAGMLGLFAVTAAVAPDVELYRSQMAVLALVPIALALAVTIWRLPSAMRIPSITNPTGQQ